MSSSYIKDLKKKCSTLLKGLIPLVFEPKDMRELLFGKEKKKPRRRIDKKLVKKIHGNQCKICGKSEKQVGELQMAHVKAHSRGGDEVIPLCPNHHRKYDKGLLTNKELKKIGISRKDYEKYQPKKRKRKKKKDIFELPRL